MEEVKDKESWNKAKIFGAVFLISILIIGGYFFKTRFLDKSLSPKETKSVKGISLKNENKDSEENLGNGIKEAVQDKIDDLRQDVFGLDIAEIASSSPQIQKIINDIKSLEKYPVNQAKEICRQICGL